MKYRVFVEDIGPGRYSAFCPATARSPAEAIRKSATRTTPAEMLIALPESRRDLWPDARTGRANEETIREGRKA